MTNEIPTLDLPDWASQDGGVITVGTFDQAFEVLAFIPEEFDPLFSIDISDRAQHIEAMKSIALAKDLGII